MKHITRAMFNRLTTAASSIFTTFFFCTAALAAGPIESTILSEGEEQPLELYIISWPDIEPMTAENPPVRLLIIEEPEALDPRVFKREIEYFDALQAQQSASTSLQQ